MTRYFRYTFPSADADIRPSCYFWGIEPHKSKSLHAHYLAEIPGYWALDDRKKFLLRREYWSRGFEWFGRTMALEFDPEKGASSYCTKYCIKGRNRDWDFCNINNLF